MRTAERNLRAIWTLLVFVSFLELRNCYGHHRLLGKWEACHIPKGKWLFDGNSAVGTGSTPIEGYAESDALKMYLH